MAGGWGTPRRVRLPNPMTVSDTPEGAWVEQRQREELLGELDAIGLVCDDACCPAVHVDLDDVLDR